MRRDESSAAASRVFRVRAHLRRRVRDRRRATPIRLPAADWGIAAHHPDDDRRRRRSDLVWTEAIPTRRVASVASRDTQSIAQDDGSGATVAHCIHSALSAAATGATQGVTQMSRPEARPMGGARDAASPEARPSSGRCIDSERSTSRPSGHRRHSSGSQRSRG